MVKLYQNKLKSKIVSRVYFERLMFGTSNFGSKCGLWHQVREPNNFHPVYSDLKNLLTIFQASANTLKSKLPHEIGKLLAKPESRKPTSSRKGSF